MTVEMKKYRLADIAEIVISSVDKKTKPGEKIVRLCNFTDVYHNWAIKQSDYDSFMVASASDNNINKLSLKKGFVAFTKDSETRDDIGISTYIADDFDDVVLGYHCALAKPNEKIVYGKYLNAFMSSDYIKKYFELNATGSGMRFTLAVSTMEDMPIMLPSLNVQKKIGDMLSDFDKRIENLRAQNRVLEQTAKTIYDYTFLQCAGHQTTYNKTLNRNIPVDWEVKKLGDCLASISTGLNPRQNFTLGNGSIKYITVKNLTLDGSIDYSGCDFIDENARAKVHKRSNIKVGDILFASISPLGRCYLIQEKPEDWDINESVFSISPADFTTSYYLYSFLRSKEFVAKAEQRATGSIFLGIRVDTLKKMEVLWPDSKTLGKFNALIEPIFKKQLVNTKQIETLTTQRNTLLPLLMTGQIEV
jgi:type I restriction enzyme S subunit